MKCVVTNLGLYVTEHYMSSLDLQEHVLWPQSTFGIEPLKLGHTVIHCFHVLTIQLAGEQVLWSQNGGSGMRKAKMLYYNKCVCLHVGAFTSTLL